MIRLLNVHTLQFKEFHESDAPAYAIASHRWRDDEATFKDVLKGRNQDSAGFAKIRGFCDFIKSWGYRPFAERVDWLWIDICCIDKKSSAELSEAINSMYVWYADAVICVAYLFDVEVQQGVHDFESSEWFKHRDWNTIGHKSGSQSDITGIPLHILGPQINERISKRTKIGADILLDHTKLDEISYEERLSWMNERRTTRVEDEAYCVLGIFDIHMPLIYGERRQATRRLLDEILRRHLAVTRSIANQTRSEQAAPSEVIGNTEKVSEEALLRSVTNLQDRITRLEAEQSSSRLQESFGRRNRRSARLFSSMLDQYNELQQQTMIENLEMQRAQAFWNPLEVMVRRDVEEENS